MAKKRWKWPYGWGFLLSGVVHGAGLSLGVYYAAYNNEVVPCMPVQPVPYRIMMVELPAPSTTPDAASLPETCPPAAPVPLQKPQTSLAAGENQPKPLPPVAPVARQKEPVPLPVTAVPLPTNTPPLYPEIAKNQGIEGVVNLRLFVGADGCVQRVDVLSVEAHALLIAAAKQAAQQWRFTVKGLRYGQTVAVTSPFVFKVFEREE